MNTHRIYTLTSIGRPVEWKVPTNRAMLILLAPAALAGAALTVWQGGGAAQAASFALLTALAAFGSWALGREIAPDDQAGAFVALALGVLVQLILGPGAGFHGVLVLFTTLGLARVVNRITGLEARLSDSLLLMALTLWVVYGTGNPLYALVGGFAFALDGSLERSPLRRQWVFALLSFGATVVYMVDHDVGLDVYSMPDSLAQWLVILTVVMFALNIALMRRVSSRTDVGRKAIEPGRVRGGMWVTLVAMAQGVPVVEEVALIAAAAFAVCLSRAIHKSFRNPS